MCQSLQIRCMLYSNPRLSFCADVQQSSKVKSIAGEAEVPIPALTVASADLKATKMLHWSKKHNSHFLLNGKNPLLSCSCSCYHYHYCRVHLHTTNSWMRQVHTQVILKATLGNAGNRWCCSRGRRGRLWLSVCTTKGKCNWSAMSITDWWYITVERVSEGAFFLLHGGG